MEAAQDTLTRIALTLGTSVDALVSQTGQVAYLRQCSELLALFAKLPDEHTRQSCLDTVRALVSGCGVG